MRRTPKTPAQVPGHASKFMGMRMPRLFARTSGVATPLPDGLLYSAGVPTWDTHEFTCGAECTTRLRTMANDNGQKSAPPTPTGALPDEHVPEDPRKIIDEATALALDMHPDEVADWRRRLAAEPTVSNRRAEPGVAA